jgi:hypothetical protein
MAPLGSPEGLTKTSRLDGLTLETFHLTFIPHQLNPTSIWTNSIINMVAGKSYSENDINVAATLVPLEVGKQTGSPAAEKGTQSGKKGIIP